MNLTYGAFSPLHFIGYRSVMFCSFSLKASSVAWLTVVFWRGGDYKSRVKAVDTNVLTVACHFLCTASIGLMFWRVCGSQTGEAYTRIGRIRVV